MMHEHEKSDAAIGAEKLANKVERSAAEPVEQRAAAKGNADQQSTRRAQDRESVSPLERVRQAARQTRKEKFTALFHHLSAAMLRTAFFALKKDAAPGVDGLTWEAYEADLDHETPSSACCAASKTSGVSPPATTNSPDIISLLSSLLQPSLSGFVESTINFAVPTDLGQSLSTLTRPRRAHREIGVMSGRDHLFRLRSGAVISASHWSAHPIGRKASGRRYLAVSASVASPGRCGILVITDAHAP